ncbi:MAG: M3 family metallopeptidase [Kiritimatiellae bacterium]|nr:M3 family metallopeptidase [Kiritimatiellia bacterium]
MSNPFINMSEFPDFAAMNPEAAREALSFLIKEANEKITAIEETGTPTWDGSVMAMYHASHPLFKAWGIVSHLLSVANSESWRELQNEFMPQIVAVSLKIGQSKKYYDILKQVVAKNDVQKRILEKSILGMELAGVALSDEKKKEYTEIATELAKLSTDFRNNVLDSTKAFSEFVTDESILEGVPEQIKSMIKTDDGWKVTIEDAVYVPVMKHAKNRALREKLYRARSTRASSGRFDNTPIIEKLLSLRQKEAELLGFSNAAEKSIATKSAPSVEAVEKMIEELKTDSKSIAEKENAELKAFCSQTVENDEDLKPWDLSYWVERMKEKLYSYSEEELSKYFDFEKVLSGLFNLSKDLFGISVEECSSLASVWHKDVRFFRVKDENGETIAHFYLDPFSRPETKSGGAWMNEFATRRLKEDGTIEKPLALICCNQSLPDENGKVLMRYGEVETLFHEFGHALQHMLTTVDEVEASGLNLIEWDAVEVASQFMENWCSEVSTLKTFAIHSETGNPIPDELIEKVRSSRNYRAANMSMRQLSFGLVDLKLHKGEYEGTPNEFKNKLFDEMMPDTRVEDDAFLNSFSHIFAGGYSAGYYSYKWSEVMSADLFGAFEEAGLENKEEVKRIGKKYRDTILALGGSCSPMKVFEMFRGRSPSIEALLRQTGLKK